MQIDPKLMEQQMKEDQRYQRTESFEPVVEYDFEDLEEEVVYDPRNEAPQGGQPIQQQYQQQEFQRQPLNIANPQYAQDDEVLPGLYESDINGWKRQFENIYHAHIKGHDFIFRSLERFEYKNILSTPNTDPLMREEMICEQCVLYPAAYDFSAMATQKAGLPAALSETIMEESGFTRDVQVRKL